MTTPAPPARGSGSRGARGGFQSKDVARKKWDRYRDAQKAKQTDPARIDALLPATTKGTPE